jgi:hypothetical protein
MPVQLFISHTKRDKEFCDSFESMTNRVGGFRVFRSEFEQVVPPAWKTIKKAISESTAIFLLVGKELVKAQELAESDPTSREVWKYTHNWIAYEVGLACQQGKDVWVVCDNVNINFPVPYLTHYEVMGIDRSDNASNDFWKGVFTEYLKTIKPPTFFEITCPDPHCKASYELRTDRHDNGTIICPTCLRTMQFPHGWPTTEAIQKSKKYYGSARGILSNLLNRALQ